MNTCIAQWSTTCFGFISWSSSGYGIIRKL